MSEIPRAEIGFVLSLRSWHGTIGHMSQQLSPDEVRRILDSGDFEALKGAVEDDRLETKRAPYKTSEEHQKLEFAKDVSALANVAGGVLLLGPATERDPSHLGDEIVSVSTYPQSLVDPETYHSILRDWVHPELEGLRIRWHPSAAHPARGIVSIDIPAQHESRKPFLVTKTVAASGRRNEVLFGYCERRRANAVPVSVHQIHGMMRGAQGAETLRALDEIREQLAALSRRFLAADAGGKSVVSANEVKLRLYAARDEVGFTSRPWIGYVSYPFDAPVKIPRLFDKAGPAVDVVESPPMLRHNGFTIGYGSDTGSSAIIRGELRRRLYRDYTIIELWHDGVLIGIAPADEDFLMWASRGSPTINPLVLAESVLTFVLATQKAVSGMEPRPKQVCFELHLTPRPDALLVPGNLDSLRRLSLHGAGKVPDETLTISVVRDPEDDAGVVAFDIVSKVYHRFGFANDDVPYTETLPDGRRIISGQAILKS